MDIVSLVIGFMVGSGISAFVVGLFLISHLQSIGCNLDPFFAKGGDNLRMKIGMKEKNKSTRKRSNKK